MIPKRSAAFAPLALSAALAVSCGRGVSTRRPTSADINAIGYSSALPLSSPLDCLEAADVDDASRCVTDAESSTLVACAYGSGSNGGASSDVFAATDVWIAARGSLAEGLRCSPERGLLTLGTAASNAGSIRASVAVPLAAARWMAVLSLLRGGDIRDGDTGRTKGLTLSFRDELSTVREEALIDRAAIGRGAARCVAATRVYTARAAADNGSALAGNASSEGGVRREFAFRVLRRSGNHVLELKATTAFDGGSTDGQLIDVALRCAAPDLDSLMRPSGFDFAFTPSTDSREWIVRAERTGGHAQ